MPPLPLSGLHHALVELHHLSDILIAPLYFDHNGWQAGRFKEVPTPYDEWVVSMRAARRQRSTPHSGGGGNDGMSAPPPEKGQLLDVLRVPHRANRALVFESRLFHQTDSMRFAEGFTKRRINVTFLFK